MYEYLLAIVSHSNICLDDTLGSYHLESSQDYDPLNCKHHPMAVHQQNKIRIRFKEAVSSLESPDRLPIQLSVLGLQPLRLTPQECKPKGIDPTAGRPRDKHTTTPSMGSGRVQGREAGGGRKLSIPFLLALRGDLRPSAELREHLNYRLDTLPRTVPILAELRHLHLAHTITKGRRFQCSTTCNNQYFF